MATKREFLWHTNKRTNTVKITNYFFVIQQIKKDSITQKII